MEKNKILLLSLILLLLISLTGCLSFLSGDDDLYGTWSRGDNLATVVFNEDKTGYMMSDNEKDFTFTWKTEGHSMTWTKTESGMQEVFKFYFANNGEFLILKSNIDRSPWAYYRK